LDSAAAGFIFASGKMPIQLTHKKNKSQLSPAAVDGAARRIEGNTLSEKDRPSHLAVQQNPINDLYKNEPSPGSGYRNESSNTIHFLDYLRIQPKLTIGAPGDTFELMHGVQQSYRSGPQSISRQPVGSGALIQRQRQAQKAPVFYQGVLDAIASEKGLVIPSGRLPFLRKLESLCIAVAAGNIKTVEVQVNNLVKAPPPHLPPHLLVYLDPDDLANELVSRIYLMGLDQPSKDLRTFLGPLVEGGRSPLFNKYDTDLELWEKIAGAAVGGAKPGSKAEALSKMDLLLRVFESMRGEAAGLNDKTIERAGNRVPRLSEMNVSVYYSRLIDLLVQIQVSLQTCFQVLMDAAVKDLEAGRGLDALKEAKAVLEGKIKAAIDLKIKRTYVGSSRVAITRSKVENTGTFVQKVFYKQAHL
jgi:hypothetical protein